MPRVKKEAAGKITGMTNVRGIDFPPCVHRVHPAYQTGLPPLSVDRREIGVGRVPETGVARYQLHHLVPLLLSFSIFLEDCPRNGERGRWWGPIVPIISSYTRSSIENQLLRFGRYALVPLSGTRCPAVRLCPRNILNGRICARSTVKIYTI